VVERVSKISCSVCGNETSRPDDYVIRDYMGSPYAMCPLCAESFRGLLQERGKRDNENGRRDLKLRPSV